MDQSRIVADTNGPCAFCKIIRGETKSAVVFEDDISLAFLDHRPLLRGHCLLIPKVHYPTFLDLPANLIGPFFTNAQRLARAVEQGLNAEGSFVGINTRISQSVPHLHLHIVPRWKKDGLFSKILIWRRQPYKDEKAMQEVQEAIRSAIRKF
jgi:histidine triad (HIT) family protein